MRSVRLLSSCLLVASISNAAAMSVRWDGPLSRSRRAVTWGGLAAAACSRLLPACPASAQNLIPPGPYREEDYYGVLLSAWPGGGPAVPDSEKSDFLVEEVRARVRARVRVRVQVQVRVRVRVRARLTLTRTRARTRARTRPSSSASTCSRPRTCRGSRCHSNPNPNPNPNPNSDPNPDPNPNPNPHPNFT